MSGRNRLTAKTAELTRPPLGENEIALMEREGQFMTEVAKLKALEEANVGNVETQSAIVLDLAKEYYDAWKRVEGTIPISIYGNVPNVNRTRKNTAPMTIYASNRTNRRTIPSNARNAITGTPIRPNERALNFNGEFFAGRYYQNSARNILNTRRNPHTQQSIGFAQWYTPKRGFFNRKW